MLDGWVKDVLHSYQKMNETQQSAVKNFLGLNRDQQKCLYLHDKLFHGIVEAPRATYGIAAATSTSAAATSAAASAKTSRGSSMSDHPPSTPPKTPRGSEVSEVPTPNGTPRDSYLATSVNGTPTLTDGGGTGAGGSRPPLFKRSLTGSLVTTAGSGGPEMNSGNYSAAATCAHRKIAYRVKIASSTSVFNQTSPSTSSNSSHLSTPPLPPPPPPPPSPVTPLKGKETIPEGDNENLSNIREVDVKAALLSPNILSSSATLDPKIDQPTNQIQNETKTKQNGNDTSQLAKGIAAKNRRLEDEQQQQSQGCCSCVIA
jgi:hypothetical protein